MEINVDVTSSVKESDVTSNQEKNSENVNKAESSNEQDKEERANKNNVSGESSAVATANKEVTNENETSKEVVNPLNEAESNLPDDSVENENTKNTKSCPKSTLEECNSQVDKLSLEENSVNEKTTDSIDVRSKDMDTDVTENISQDENKVVSLAMLEVTEKSTINDSSNCNELEPLETERCLDNAEAVSKMKVSEDVETNNEVVVSSKEKESDNNLLGESQTDVQMSINETSNTNSKKSDIDSTLEEQEKEVSEKNIIEPENTEFVQFSQDKHGDSQIESQSMDAEDPFGGESFAAESVEHMETDELTETAVGFPKLCGQADNLKDIVNARDSSFSSGNKENDKEKDSCVDELESSDLTKSESVQNKLRVSAKKSVENVKEAEPNKSLAIEVAGSTENCNAQSKKSVDEIAPMDTGEEQSHVLPGQDDELCIIPDSMKVIIPRQSAEKSGTDVIESTKDKTDKQDTVTQGQQDNDCNASTEKDLPINSKEPVAVESEASTTEVETVEKEHVSTVGMPSTTADVINLDEESKNSEIEEITSKEICKQCNEERSCKIKVKIGQDSYNVCSKTCKALFKAANNKAMDIPSDGVNSKREKRCANCLLIVESNDERNLSWETMEFCNEECLGKFQTKYGSYCRNCNGSVQAVSLGKYCVRFGYDVRQFCCSTCLEEFKKGLKVCSYCQKDISSSTEGFLAPVGDKGQFKDFCTQDCMEKYSKMSCVEPPNMEKKCCSVCQEEKVVHCEVQIDRGSPVVICSEPCFAAFKFVKKVDPDQCSTCKKFFELPNKKSFVVFYENEAHMFCTKTCLNIFIITNRKIVPCNWCKVKKYNFDMIKKELKTGQVMMMCSLNCLTLYQVSINAVSAKRINCDFCKEFSQAQYHLTMSDATIRNFCSYNCVMNFQAQYTKSPITIPSSDDPVPTGMPKRTVPVRNVSQNVQKGSDLQNKKNMPVISSVTSLAAIGNGQASPTSQQNNVNNMVMSSSTIGQNQASQVIYKQHIITRPPSPVQVHNKTTQCKPLTHTKGVSVRPHPCTKSTQTDGVQQVLVPIPVPIYVPYPMHMYSMPFPVPLPFPLPIPVPIFIPTTRNSTKGILKDIKRIQEKIPADPFEAELLMMAEMVATDKKANESESDSADEREDDAGDRDNSHSGGFSPEGVDSSHTFGDDMLQMALKMATGELDEPAVDLEAALTPNTITATQASTQPEATMDNDVQSERLIVAARGRKRMVPCKPRSTPNKRGRRVSGANDMPLMPPPEPHPPPQPRIIEPIEKPDANMALKYTFGVNAWRQWVVAKNAELEKQSTPVRKMKLFKTDLLQLTADELNYSLCLFVKEVRKPNGAEYAPDTIYYLCLGIQQYLFENNRIDNIFTDSYYEKFTDCLNEVAKKFCVLYNDAQYIVTRVEEEHLWECKQLGAHSPHVLLSTLMFFNTKHFNLVTVEEHMQLSFSHIMKHWKRNPAAQPTAATGKVPGSRNVLLRFYPPQSALEGNSRKKKVYEQQENEENPLRCPVKLYEFYLSKCPESVKTRNDVFYLLPERSCVPDSPVWYSTSPLAKEHLIKMLYRVKMVKEINVALLTS